MESQGIFDYFRFVQIQDLHRLGVRFEDIQGFPGYLHTQRRSSSRHGGHGKELRMGILQSHDGHEGHDRHVPR